VAITTRFNHLSSEEAKKPDGIWNWAKRLVNTLSRWKLFNLMDVPFGDKAFNVVRINEDGTDFEYAPELMESLRGISLVGKAGKAVVVNATEDGFEIAP
jgi:hypothetical protein